MGVFALWLHALPRLIFFRGRIDHMINLCGPLPSLASRMPWLEIEAYVAHLLLSKARAGVSMPDSGPNY